MHEKVDKYFAKHDIDSNLASSLASHLNRGSLLGDDHINVLENPLSESKNNIKENNYIKEKRVEKISMLSEQNNNLMKSKNPITRITKKNNEDNHETIVATKKIKIFNDVSLNEGANLTKEKIRKEIFTELKQKIEKIKKKLDGKETKINYSSNNSMEQNINNPKKLNKRNQKSIIVTGVIKDQKLINGINSFHNEQNILRANVLAELEIKLAKRQKKSI